ncbi:MAG: D-alanine--D-alanine ligase [Parcubacteria group bacterium]|nr:D-alanine--D-alanine ligase [Parcubacteria group bacterium]
MGGRSSEHDISLETGKNVIRAIAPPYEAIPIRLTRDNIWIFKGERVKPEDALSNVDVVFQAMHGEYGEDGRMQSLLEQLGVPYTGSGPLASHRAMDKIVSRRMFEKAGIPVPEYLPLNAPFESTPASEHVLAAIRGPWVVKPVHCGSSVGVSLVRDPRDLPSALEHARTYDRSVLIEQYLNGREVTCGVIEGFPRRGVHPLPVTEIRPENGHTFFDYEAKYSPATHEITPAPISRATTHLVQYLAKRAYDCLGCRGYARADFILSNGRPYLLEVNTLPGLTVNSLFPKAAAVAGLRFEKLVTHLIRYALRR